ncbi:hypothetical protein GYN67_09760 [Lactococcus piscium]|uniref:hypothetical protein n=1 Tax=Pseudolactococcus carnosus TaxID=2749961 RepID=UPI001FB88753|nr:hypothetical protein [Lactococcus carnosus]MCJ1996976.1 hypothetical protein [Lactococcus carnosus]
MINKNTVKVSFLFVLLYMLTIALFLYREKQVSLYMESNNLYTKNAMKVVGNYKKLLSKYSQPINVFKTIANTDDIRVVSSTTQSLKFPVYAGKNFGKQNQKALVGSAVPIVKISGKSFFDYENKLYEVIGYLGTEKNSLLADKVLLKDDALFASTKTGVLIIDSPRSLKKYDDLKTDTVGNMLGRRTNIDYISPMIIIYTSLLILLLTIVIGIFIYLYTHIYNKILYIKGISHKSILRMMAFKIIVLFGLINISCLILSALFIKISITPDLLLVMGLSITSVQGSILTCYMLERGYK